GAANYKRLFEGDYDSNGDYQGYSDIDDAFLQVRGDQIVSVKLADGTATPVGGPLNGLQPSVRWDVLRDVPVAISAGRERITDAWLDSELGGLDASLHRAF